MSKARSMYAGSSGYNYSVNKNSPGNGNGKWQGLWPSVGHARNARHINTRAGGDNRNVVFCMNQLGGVGRISNMFATTADGVKDCKNGCILPNNIKHALQQLTNYASKRGLLLGLAGVNETVQSDLPNTSGLTPFVRHFPSHLQRHVDLINGLGLEFAVKSPNDIQRHVVVMLTKTDAEKLKVGGYGVLALCDSIIAYGGNCNSFKLYGDLANEAWGYKGSVHSGIGGIPGQTSAPTITFTTPAQLGGAKALNNNNNNNDKPKLTAIENKAPIITIQVGEQPHGTLAGQKDIQAFLDPATAAWSRAGWIHNHQTKADNICYMAPKSSNDGSTAENLESDSVFRNEMIIQGIGEAFEDWKSFQLPSYSGELSPLPAGKYTLTFLDSTIWNKTVDVVPIQGGHYYKMSDIHVKIGNDGPICPLF